MEQTSYLKNIWAARHFWLHLAFADIRTKYRRSLLGLAWAFIQPLAITLLLAFVMGRFFHSAIKDYAPFIFSGLILWEFIVSSTVNGCTSFINAEGYIKQFSHPLIIYSLRSVIPCMINLLCAFVGLIIWTLLWKPENFGHAWLGFFISFPILFLFAWPLCTITAFIGIRFRDFSQLIVIILQALYFVSPVFFLPAMFSNSNMGFLIEYNPISHVLNLFRNPLLEGSWPSLDDYLYVLATAALFWLCVWRLINRNENKVIFYL